ncbi:CCA tRNA nucleotidyltransferase [Thermobrachium celere]|uniref:tRNA nucleotidyltransferase, CC-adding n=1 Tax=Thermobrachium celere DSM 8682 TaxID=941824 RepID=R7RPN1_9CLOT|nr:CCA tRNA nucleotidyltransferase [Thermobrachium celere]CDF57185.1 tRNA nucleotidyltransferase, CC-adding [Thermobrachium celere DSM 8682]
MRYLDEIKAYSLKNNIPIYLVGGAVRDILLQREISDYDFVSKYFKDVSEYFSKLVDGNLIKLHDDVYRVVVDGVVFDFTNFKGDSIEEDLKNRDFTINAIAYDFIKDEYIDILGGMDDLRRGIIKHTSDNIVKQDALRILRAYRLKGELNFNIHDDTLRLFKRDVDYLNNIKGERIVDELFKILKFKNSYDYIQMLDDIGVIDSIFPIMKEMKKIGKCKYHLVDAYTHSTLALKFLEDRYKELYSTKWGNKIEEYLEEQVGTSKRIEVLKLAIFLHDIGKVKAFKEIDGKITFRGHDLTGVDEFNLILKRLPLSNAKASIIKSVITGHMRILGLFKQGASDKAVYKLIKDYKTNLPSVLISSLYDVLATRSLLDENGESQRYFEFVLNLFDRYYTFLEKRDSFISGDDVCKILDIRGPKVGEVLENIHELIFKGKINSREEAIKMLRSQAKA